MPLAGTCTVPQNEDAVRLIIFLLGKSDSCLRSLEEDALQTSSTLGVTRAVPLYENNRDLNRDSKTFFFLVVDSTQAK